jgi:hypothetical protein
MRSMTRFRAIFIANVLAMGGTPRAQQMQMPKQEQSHHMEMSPVKAEYPRMGRAQEHAQGVLVTLEQVQKIASDSNPTMRQAEA